PTRGTRCLHCSGASAAAATTSRSSARSGASTARSGSAPPRTSWPSCSPTPAGCRSTGRRRPQRPAHPNPVPLRTFEGVDDRDPGTPVGRRVFLGLVGLGAAGILLGARAQDWLERAVGPLISKDGTGLASLLPIGRFRIYTVTGDLPSRSRARWTLRVDG